LSAYAAAAQAGADAALAVAEAAVAQAQATLEESRKPASDRIAASQLALSADGAYVLVTGADQRARIFSTTDGQLVDQMEQVALAALCPDGNVLVAAADKSLRFSAPRRGWKLARTIGKPEDPATFADRILALSFSPDGRLLATAGGDPSRSGELKVWRVADGSLLRAWDRPHGDTINAVAFSPDGEFIATGASDRLVRIWRASDSERVANFEGHTGHVYSLAWRGDAFQLASGGADKSLRLWDILDGKLTKTTSDFGREVNAVGYAGNGELLFAASGDKAVRLADQPLPDSAAYVHCATADALGRYIAAGASDGRVRVWRVADRKVARVFADPAPSNSVTAR
jgi:WD40 repeat protein